MTKLKNNLAVRRKISPAQRLRFTLYTGVVLIALAGIVFLTGNFQDNLTGVVCESKDEHTGTWVLAKSWVGDKSPGPQDQYVINGKITRNGSLNLLDKQSLTINSSDTLLIMGHLSLAEHSTLKVMDNAVLIVKGNYKSLEHSNDEIKAGGSITVSGMVSFIGTSAGIVTEPGAKVIYDPQLNPAVATRITGGGSVIEL